MLVAARLRNSPSGYVSGSLRRLSLHRYAPVRQGADAGANGGNLLANDTATAPALLGPEPVA